MGKLRRAIGLMSGTSLDGVDVALIETDGDSLVRRGPGRTYPYDQAMRRLLVSAIAEARVLDDRDARPGVLATAEIRLTDRHIAAVELFLTSEGIASDDIDVIGFHGQTVLHRPEDGLTLQLGSGQRLADSLRIPVVYDMRAADMVAGGQGAPLVPVYHRALVRSLSTDAQATVVVNIGGVANVTYVGEGETLLAFDCGPGNALIDDWMARHGEQACDVGGEKALAGSVHDDLVERFLSHPFFAQSPPKSLDRNAFGVDLVDDLSLSDGAATLAAMTVAGIAATAQHFPSEPERWIISGGGRHNKAIMQGLKRAVHGQVLSAEDAGFTGDSVEAEAWAYLAVRSLDGKPLTFPGTTGVLSPQTGGVLSSPNKRSAAS